MKIRSFIDSCWHVLFTAILQALATIVILQSGQCAAGLWDANFVTTDSAHYRLESPPAHDSDGNVVAVGERHITNGLPTIYVARSANSGTSWTYTNNIRSTDDPTSWTDSSPVVVADGAGQWLCVWSSDDPLSGTLGSDFDVLFSRSEDAGVSWSAPAVLNSTGPFDNGHDVEPWVSMDSAGNCIAAWTSDNDPNDVSDTTSPVTAVWISRSTDAGRTWSVAEPFQVQQGQSVFEPNVASNRAGHFGIVWSSRQDQDFVGEVKFAWSENAGTTWSEAVVVNADNGSSFSERLTFDPALAGDASGRWMIAWSAVGNSLYGKTGNVAYVARTEDVESDWQVSSIPWYSDEYEPSVYCDNSGTWIVTGNSGYDGYSRMRASLNFGASWANIRALPSTLDPYMQSVGAPEPPSTTPFLWRKDEVNWNVLQSKQNRGYNLRYGTSLIAPVPPVNTEWSKAKPLSADSVPLPGKNPKLAVNSENWVAVFTKPGTEGADDEIGFSRSVDGGISWSEPRILNSDWQDEAFADKLPVIAASDKDTWICAWERSDGNIWLARSADAGETWSVPEALDIPGEISGAGIHPGISSLGDDQWLVVWEFRAIYSARSTDDGTTWEPATLVRDSYGYGPCGNTSSCGGTGYFAPAVTSTPGNQTVFVGFKASSWSRPSGYSGGVYTSTYEAGHVSYDGGLSYVGNVVFGPYGGGLEYMGGPNMAVDGDGNWLRVTSSGSSVGTSLDNGESFTYTSAPSVDGRAHLWGRVAMDHRGHWFHFLGAQQYQNLATKMSPVLLAVSNDLGHSWSPQTLLDTTNSYRANTAANLEVKGGARGKFVAVWQAALPTGEQTIWYSTNQTYALSSVSSDWHLLE